MKYDQGSEDLYFPNYQNKDSGHKSYDNTDEEEDKLSNKKMWIIISIILLIILVIIIIALVIYFHHKNKKNNGGYIIAKYIIKSNKKIKIFNPSYVNLGPKDYSIEIMEFQMLNNNNNIRNLENGDVVIEKNKFTSNKNGIIKLKINLKFNLISMVQIFEQCYELIEVDLSNLVSSNIMYMSSAFSLCEELKSINFGNFKSSKVITMYATFENCKSLMGLDLSSFKDVSNLKSLNSAFRNCHQLSFLNLNNFIFKKDVNLREIFGNDYNLKVVLVKDMSTKNKIYLKSNFANDINVDCIIGENEKCKECNSNEGEKYKCKSCNDGYVLPDIDFPTNCIRCFIDNCERCSEYLKCESCKDGYYLTNNNNECLNCENGCSKCNGLNNCTECEDNYELFNNSICLEKKITDITETTSFSEDPISIINDSIILNISNITLIPI